MKTLYEENELLEHAYFSFKAKQDHTQTQIIRQFTELVERLEAIAPKEPTPP